ncbi:MbnP family copper-binding protein [Thioalkalivibrio paradoxus]|uniref:Copper-binding protein MbnP-like domain-containing protein n=1 Tax=Thioalkalivibrio paradoxus ARh 1 TaxID=713585 RepID=W0DPY6_9GAMM|nr:MbnP family copper-binding protein [Thioalkalivibrio paradoxus]AHE99063.1 hypothetical protein THITH_13235 [Thioalkalivibrio paradoxus ARh 1]
MHNTHRLLTLAVASAFTAACGGSGSSTGDPGQGGSNPTSQEVVIPFQAHAAGTPIACDQSLHGLGLSGTEARLADFALFVHDVRLIADDGTEIPLELEQSPWQFENVALLDFQDRGDFCLGADKPMNHEVRGTAAYDPTATTIAGLRFIVGVPHDLNHIDASTAPSPLNRTTMFWNWQGGYKFMRFDVEPVGGILRPSDPEFSGSRWNFHLGSTGCTGDPAVGETVSCMYPNRVDVALDGFSPEQGHVNIDYARLVESSNLGIDAGGAAGCMSGTGDPECGPVFQQLGIALGDGPEPSLPQAVFTVGQN